MKKKLWFFLLMLFVSIGLTFCEREELLPVMDEPAAKITVEEKFKDAFGAIYNWHAVGTGKLCPTGWHVPTNSDWTTLITSLGGIEEPFNEMTQNAMIFCDDLSIYECGFTPVPQGELCGWGFLKSDLWWSATPRPTDLPVPYAYVLALRIKAYEPQSYGYSVRCLKD